MLDEKRSRMIDMIMEGRLSKTEIAKQIPCSRQALYDWLAEDEVKAEIDKRMSGIRTEVQKRFTKQLEPVVDELYKIALGDNDVRTRNNACQYLINRVLGSPKESLNVEDNRGEEVADVLAAFNRIVAENNDVNSEDNNE